MKNWIGYLIIALAGVVVACSFFSLPTRIGTLRWSDIWMASVLFLAFASVGTTLGRALRKRLDPQDGTKMARVIVWTNNIAFGLTFMLIWRLVSANPGAADKPIIVVDVLVGALIGTILTGTGFISAPIIAIGGLVTGQWLTAACGAVTFAAWIIPGRTRTRIQDFGIGQGREWQPDAMLALRPQVVAQWPSTEPEEGEYELILESPGDRHINTVAVLRRKFDVDLRGAKRITEAIPKTLIRSSNRRLLEHVREEFEEAGATARVKNVG